MSEKNRPARVLWFPYAQRGSLYPVMPLIRRLLADSVEVKAVGPRSLSDFADRQGLLYRSYHQLTDYDWSRAESVDPRSRGPQNGPGWFHERVGTETEEALAAIDEYRPDVVLSDSLFLGGGLAAEERGLPWASYVHYLFDESAETDDLYRRWWSRDGEALDDYVGWWNSLRESVGLKPESRGLSEAPWYRTSPDLTLILTHPALRIQNARPLPGYVRRAFFEPWDEAGPDNHPVGPVEGAVPRVLATNSSAWQADLDLVQATIDSRSEIAIEVVATVAADHRPPDSPAGTAVTLPYSSHRQLLPTVDAVVTNCGAGIVGKALWFGVPVVAVPFGRDQHFVAETLVGEGLGVSVDWPPTSETVGAALRAVLYDEELRGRVRAAAGPPADVLDESAAAEQLIGLAGD